MLLVYEDNIKKLNIYILKSKTSIEIYQNVPSCVWTEKNNEGANGDIIPWDGVSKRVASPFE